LVCISVKSNEYTTFIKELDGIHDQLYEFGKQNLCPECSVDILESEIDHFRALREVIQLPDNNARKMSVFNLCMSKKNRDTSQRTEEDCLSYMCTEREKRYYKCNSPWKNYSREERIEKISNIYNQTLEAVKKDNTVIHKKFSKDLLMCIVKNESSIHDFDPLSLNFTYCLKNNRNKWKYSKTVKEYDRSLRFRIPPSSAHGMVHFTFRTFCDMRKDGTFVFSSTTLDDNLDIKNEEDNYFLFRKMAQNPSMQIEAASRYLNRLIHNYKNVDTAIRRYYGGEESATRNYLNKVKKCMSNFQKLRKKNLSEKEINNGVMELHDNLPKVKCL